MLAPPAGLQGTSGKPITIRAEQDGAVFIDGEYRHAPLNLQNNHWLVIEGVNVANSRQEAINVTQSTHIILRRIVRLERQSAGPDRLWRQSPYDVGVG